MRPVGKLGDAFKESGYLEAMASVAARVEADMFGAARSDMARWTTGMLRLLKREQDAMTAEELESALVGHSTQWEHWGEEGTKVTAGPFVPDDRMYGISGKWSF